MSGNFYKFNLSVDNNAALCYLLKKKGKPVYIAPASTFWYENTSIGAAVWITRVPSYANTADLLTRWKKREILQRVFPGMFEVIEVYREEKRVKDMLCGKADGHRTRWRVETEYETEVLTDDEEI